MRSALVLRYFLAIGGSIFSAGYLHAETSSACIRFKGYGQSLEFLQAQHEKVSDQVLELSIAEMKLGHEIRALYDVHRARQSDMKMDPLFADLEQRLNDIHRRERPLVDERERLNSIITDIQFYGKERAELNVIHNRSLSPQRELILKKYLQAVDNEIKLHSGPTYAMDALQNTQLMPYRFDASHTMSQSPGAIEAWKNANAQVVKWIQGGEPFSLKKLQQLNAELQTYNESIPEDAPDFMAKLEAQRFRNGNAGEFRNWFRPVEVGAGVARKYPPANTIKMELAEFQRWMDASEAAVQKGGLHPIRFAAEAAERLLSIHPFFDGNGRTSKLLCDWILVKHGYPPAILSRRKLRSRIAVFDDGTHNISAGATHVRVLKGVIDTIWAVHRLGN